MRVGYIWFENLIGTKYFPWGWFFFLENSYNYKNERTNNKHTPAAVGKKKKVSKRCKRKIGY